MPSLFKGYSFSPSPNGYEEIFTATTPTIIGSIIGVTNQGSARAIRLGVQRLGAVAGVTESLLGDLSIASGSSVNLIPSKVTLNTGDKLVALSNGVATGNYSQTAGIKINLPTSCWPSDTNTVFLSNPSGSIIVAAFYSSGIWTSLDGQLTAQKTSTTSITSIKPAIFFAGAFHIYINATTKMTSTDGITWTTVTTCNNCPTIAVNRMGSLFVNGTSLVGLFSSNQLVSSTDAINFSNFGSTTPYSVTSMCWTGTKYVVGYNSLSPSVGVAGSTATGWVNTQYGDGASTLPQGLGCNGATVVMNLQGTLYVSVDHGVNFATTGAYCYSTSPIVPTGSGFLVSGSSPSYSETWSLTGLISSWNVYGYTNSYEGFGSVLGSTYGFFAIAGTRLIAPNIKSLDLVLTRRGGLTLTASVLEVS